MDNSKQEYIAWCSTHSMPVFMQPWWMDAVCHSGKQWQVLLYKLSGDILAVCVFHYIEKHGFRMVLQPELTPYSGWWMSPQLSAAGQQEAAAYMLGQLEEQHYDYIQLAFRPQAPATDVLRKHGYKVQERPTYILYDIEQDGLLEKFHSSKRRQVKKAEGDLHFATHLSVEEFCRLHSWQYGYKDTQDMYTRDLLLKVCHGAIAAGHGQICSVNDHNNVCHAAALVVWDEWSAYYLLYYIHPEHRSSGGSSMLVYEIIKFLQGKTHHFDFEGGSQPNVAASYAKFGTEMTPWILAEKYKNIFVRLLMTIYKHKK